MHVQVATPAGSNVNTQLPHKVQKCTDMARNTVNNKLTTSKHCKTSKSTQQRVSVKYNPPPPHPPAFDCWTPNTHQQIGQGLGYTSMSSSSSAFYLALLSSKCRVRSRKIINIHNGRVSVELGRGKSLICITVE